MQTKDGEKFWDTPVEDIEWTFVDKYINEKLDEEREEDGEQTDDDVKDIQCYMKRDDPKWKYVGGYLKTKGSVRWNALS